MGQPHRIEFAGAWFHVTARAVWGRELFVDDVDRRSFLRRLATIVARYGWQCTGYCLMTTHHHLLVRLTRPNLAPGMQELHSVHARRFNARHGRHGHVFAERYAPTLLQGEAHVLQAHRCVALNPVAAALASAADGWRWSSHGATLGAARRPQLLHDEPLLALFGADDVRARALYAAFVAAGSSGASQTVASGGSVTSADCAWPHHSVASASSPRPLPTSEPP
jgi:putative transposase